MLLSPKVNLKYLFFVDKTNTLYRQRLSISTVLYTQSLVAFEIYDLRSFVPRSVHINLIFFCCHLSSNGTVEVVTIVVGILSRKIIETGQQQQ